MGHEVLLARGCLLHHPLQHERHLLQAAQAFGLKDFSDGAPEQLAHVRGVCQRREGITRREHALELGELWRRGEREARVLHFARW